MELTYNQFEVLTIIEREKNKLSQRNLADLSNLSLGTVNKVMAHENTEALAEISGGAVNGAVTAEEGATILITGGTFDIDPTAYVADGYTATKITRSTDNAEITDENDDYASFCKALNYITTALCRKIAKDGEGATKLLECKVSGAKTLPDAKIVAKSVITSSLFKAAMFGADANWGIILCAIGYSGANVDITKIAVSLSSQAGVIEVCENGSGIEFSEDEAKKILTEDEIIINIDLGDGEYDATAWGCDLTYDYVKINGDYRT